MEPRQNRREHLYRIIFFTDTPAGQYFDSGLLICILASLVVVMLDSIEAFHHAHGDWLLGLEWGFTAIFAIEYMLRLYCAPRPLRYAFSFFGLIDLLAILPAFLGLLYGDAQYLLIIRVLRLIRVFRVFKLRHYMKQANFLLTALQGSQQKIIVFFVCIATLVTVFGALMYVIEGPQNGFTSIPKGIYWAIVTLTTVGFGDVVPKTVLGQAMASLVMITGYSVIAVPTGIFGAELANAMRGGAKHKHDCPGCSKSEHDTVAAFCDRCGAALYPRQKLETEAFENS